MSPPSKVNSQKPTYTSFLTPSGVALNQAKTRIVHIARGFEFLGFKIQRGKGKFRLTSDRIKSKLNRQNLYAIATQKSVDRFKDQILKAGYGKTVRPVCAADGGKPFIERLLRPDTEEVEGNFQRSSWREGPHPRGTADRRPWFGL